MGLQGRNALVLEKKRLLYWRTQAVLGSSWPSQKCILRLVYVVTQRPPSSTCFSGGGA